MTKREDQRQADAEREVIAISSPGPEETVEQGQVRTGRQAPRHDGAEDSAGLTPAATAARVAHTHEQRDELHRLTGREGHAADGDALGGART